MLSFFRLHKWQDKLLRRALRRARLLLCRLRERPPRLDKPKVGAAVTQGAQSRSFAWADWPGVRSGLIFFRGGL